MGVSYNKGKPYLIEFDQIAGNLEDCPNQFCDRNQIGNVYLVQHKVISATAAKCSHFSIYIDIAGASVPNKYLAGIHAHLVVFKLATIKTNLLYNYESRNWNEYDDVHFVGQLNPDQILMHGTPVVYAIILQGWLHQWYKDLVILNGNNINWSSKLNCQKYAYKTIVALGLNWPQRYRVADDVDPYVVDIYTKGTQATADTTEKFR